MEYYLIVKNHSLYWTGREWSVSIESARLFHNRQEAVDCIYFLSDKEGSYDANYTVEEL